MADTPIVRTYLEMRSRQQLQGAPLASDARVERVRDCPLSFFRYLYREVGRDYSWRDRLGWTDEQCRTHMSDPAISLFVLYVAGAPAGYFELNARERGAIEIAYFGLLPHAVGRKLGTQLLTAATEAAWSLPGTSRVWLHTCTLDHPAALPNYLARGFVPYKKETLPPYPPATAPA